jgi:hypothetical protein
MAEKISNHIFAIFKKEDLEKLNWINNKIEKGANAGAHTGYMHQSFSEGDIILGSISFTQAVISSTDLLGVTKSLGATAGRFISGASGLLDLAYVDIKIYRSLTDGKELTTYKNQLELSDGLTLLSGGITFTGALIGATTTLFPVAVALAKEFSIWAKENKVEAFNNGGASAANKEMKKQVNFRLACSTGNRSAYLIFNKE